MLDTTTQGMTRGRFWAGALVALVLAATLTPPPVHAQAAATAGDSAASAARSEQAKAVFDGYWARTAELFPESATYRGDHRFGDRLNDGSPEARARWFGSARDVLSQLQALPRQDLGTQDRMSVDVLARRLERSLSMEPFAGYESMTVDASPWPFQAAFNELLRASPVSTQPQARMVLARMAAYPARVEQAIANLRSGMAQGWVPSRHVLEVVLQQLDTQLAKRGRSSIYFEPFDRLGAAIPEAARESLRREGEAAVGNQVLPAIRRLRDFVATDYMASAPDEGGLVRYPGGLMVYETVVRNETTTALTADAIHAIGLEQLAKAREGMEAVRREVAFAGDMQAFVKHLNTHPRFFKRSGQEVLAGYRDIVKRVEPELPRLFAQLPRAPVGVRAIPEFLGIGAVESYNGPSLDGTRPGWFNANTLAYAVRPTNQAWRAARLVVDTGIHARGWTLRQAIDSMSAATGMERTRVEWEVDRYISQPGQALTYMIGQLKIIELREKARRALGPRFDIRRFHMAVLDQGQLPLDLLERAIDDWIAAQMKAP